MAATRRYITNLADEALTSLLSVSPIHVGGLADLTDLAARLEGLDERVHSMEVVERDGKNDVLRIDFSMLGLDGEDDWDIPNDPQRMRALLADKLAAMRDSGVEFRIELWMGE